MNLRHRKFIYDQLDEIFNFNLGVWGLKMKPINFNIPSIEWDTFNTPWMVGNKGTVAFLNPLVNSGYSIKNWFDRAVNQSYEHDLVVVSLFPCNTGSSFFTRVFQCSDLLCFVSSGNRGSNLVSVIDNNRHPGLINEWGMKLSSIGTTVRSDDKNTWLYDGEK